MGGTNNDADYVTPTAGVILCMTSGSQIMLI